MNPEFNADFYLYRQLFPRIIFFKNQVHHIVVNLHFLLNEKSKAVYPWRMLSNDLIHENIDLGLRYLPQVHSLEVLYLLLVTLHVFEVLQHDHIQMRLQTINFLCIFVFRATGQTFQINE